MGDTPAFGVRFHPYRPLAVVRAPEPEPAPEPGRVPIYELGLALASRCYAVLEHAEAERYFLRDQLERKSATVPQLVAQGLATADMTARRALYQRARMATTDCTTLLDLLAARPAIPRDALEAARAAATQLVDALLPLTVPPAKIW
jgi:hypothetical protein